MGMFICFEEYAAIKLSESLGDEHGRGLAKAMFGESAYVPEFWRVTLEWAKRSGRVELWEQSETAEQRAIHEDPAAFTPGHPDCEEE